MFSSFTNHLLNFVLRTVGGTKMNEAPLLLSRILIQINIIQQIIAIEEVKENTMGV